MPLAEAAEPELKGGTSQDRKSGQSLVSGKLQEPLNCSFTSALFFPHIEAKEALIKCRSDEVIPLLHSL